MTRDEAIEIVRNIYQTDSEKEALGTLIPELAESEYERIRKALIEGVSQIRCKGDVTREQMLTYLEKQKEQKSAEWDELQSEFKNINEAFEDGKKEVIAHPEKYDLCKPTEWSEEDEKMHINILNLLCSQITYVTGQGTTSGRQYPTYAKERDWFEKRFKSLRLQSKKNDMITPNKEFFQWIYDRLVNVHNENPNVDYMISFKRRIEELSFDQPSWKPSEEDIKMLEHIIGQYETGNKNSKVMGYLPRVEELDFLKKILAKWKN